MNINTHFKTPEEINNYLVALNNSDWGKEGISADNIQHFITSNLKIIANQKDRQLHDHLMTLSDRVTLEWSDPKANILAFEIMGIAKGVFNETEAPELLNTIWKEIFSHIPPRAPATPDLFLKTGGHPSGLEDKHPSKAISTIALSEEAKWAGEELISLKKYGCNTAKDAVKYIIDKKLTGANLSEFPDLEDKDLKELFEKCPQINQLFIKSNNITSLPLEAKNLKVLICSGCVKLQSLPELSQVEVLNCSGCLQLQSLPKIPLARFLNCSLCNKLKQLPELPDTLQVLECSSIHSLTQIPKLPSELLELICHDCSIYQLPSLPPKLQKLSCGELLIEHLPELPEGLLVLHCWHLSITQLPDLPAKLRELDCSYCREVNQLPQLPAALQVLNCEQCPLDDDNQKKVEAFLRKDL